MGKVYVGDINTKIRLDAGRNISSAAKIEIKYKKPDGTKGTWTAKLEGTDYGYYLTAEDDLNQNGVWEVQLYVEVDNWKGHGEIDNFTVYETLQ